MYFNLKRLALAPLVLASPALAQSHLPNPAFDPSWNNHGNLQGGALTVVPTTISPPLDPIAFAGLQQPVFLSATTGTPSPVNWTPNIGIKYLDVCIKGGSGGGSGNGTAGLTNGTAGGYSSFDPQGTSTGSYMYGAQGAAAFGATGGNSAGGATFGSTLNLPLNGSEYILSGEFGASTINATGAAIGGKGGGSGGGTGGVGGVGFVGTKPGVGGGGAGGTGALIAGAGGQEGGQVCRVITIPDPQNPPTFTYNVGGAGLGGAAGTSGFAGGNGQAGSVIVKGWGG